MNFDESLGNPKNWDGNLPFTQSGLLLRTRGGCGIRQPISHPQTGYENESRERIRLNSTELSGTKPFQDCRTKKLPSAVHTHTHEAQWICSRRGTLNAGCRSGSCCTSVYCTCRVGWVPSAMWSIDATSAVPHGVKMQQFTSGPADMCSHPRTESMRWHRVTSGGSMDSHYTTWVANGERCDSKMLPCTNQVFLSIKPRRSNFGNKL